MSFATDTGEMLVLHVFKAGSVFPLPWVINNTPNRYYFESLTPVELARSPREDVLQYLKNHPDVQAHLMSKVLLGLTGMMQRMEFLVFDSAYKKTILLLLYYVKNFSDSSQRGKLMIPLTHKEIAAWIGTTRETASLQIELLKKNKLIQYNRRYIIVPDVSLLAKEIGEITE